MIYLVLAMLLDFALGDPYWFPHPVIQMGKVIKYLEIKGRLICKGDNAIKLWGGLIVLVVAGASFLIPYYLLVILRFNPLIYGAANVILLWTTIASKCLYVEANKVYRALKLGDTNNARTQISYLVGRDTSKLNEKEITRACVETVAENTSDGVIAPILYGILGGAPLAMMYKAINTMDSMLGYLTKEYKHIGYFPAKVDDLFNLIPARLSGTLMCIGSPIVKGNIYGAFKIMIRDRRNHKSPNCAYPEGAVAGALGIRLGGDNVYHGEIIKKPSIGDPHREIEIADIKRTTRLMFFAQGLLVAVYIVVMVWRSI